MTTEEQRVVARRLAARALSDGQPTRWFEELYAAADRGETGVPWAELAPNPILLRKLAGLDVAGKRTLVVGCGYGDDAALLAQAGAEVTAFDIAPTAVRRCERRFPELGITWTVGDALAPPPTWHRAFDLVVEIYTLQVLPAPERAVAGVALGRCVADGGRLFVFCRGREPEDPPGSMPWPLTADEVVALATEGLELERFEDFLDAEEPPVRRLLAVLCRNP
ncbi:MAG: class I SAM-dependent methyltransferase [Frankiaceae bacterium]|nr:class I SAM-dependent methyltransferase [Frankiaceae bacterium]